MKKIKRFIKSVINRIKDFFKQLLENYETIIILSLATIGLCFIIGKIPFTISLPAIFENKAVIQAISLSIIWVLTWSMKIRTA